MNKCYLSLAFAILISASHANAAEIRVFSGGAPQAVLRALAPDFEATTGHKVVFTFQIVGEIQRRISAGEKADLIMLPSQLIAETGKLVPLGAEGRGVLARVGIGVIMRDNAPRPDISNEERVRKILLGAKAIALSEPTTPSGRHLTALLARLGIPENGLPRRIHKAAIDGGGELVATSQADLGLYLVSEVQNIKGISVIGLLPPTMQSYVVYATAIPAANQTPEPALAFIRFLTASDKAERWRRAGFELSHEP